MDTDLNAVVMEQALVPGTKVQLVYRLGSTETYLIASWLGLMESRFEDLEPLWMYEGYIQGDNEITFKFRLRTYAMSIDGTQVIPIDPATGKQVEPKSTWYAAAGSVKSAVERAEMAVAGFSWMVYERGKAVAGSTVEAAGDAVEAVKSAAGDTIDAAKVAGDWLESGAVIAIAAVFIYIIERMYK